MLHTMTDYHPIDCGLHSEYELAIMHRQRLRLCWQDPDGTEHIEVIMPLDLQTRAGEEFLIVRTAAGERLHIRLDRIRQAGKAGA